LPQLISTMKNLEEKRYLIVDIKRNEPLYWTHDENNNSVVPVHWTLHQANFELVRLIGDMNSKESTRHYSKKQRKNPYKYFKIAEYKPLNYKSYGILKDISSHVNTIALNEACQDLLKSYYRSFCTKDGNEYTEQDVIDNLSIEDIKLLDKRFNVLQNIFYPLDVED